MIYRLRRALELMATEPDRFWGTGELELQTGIEKDLLSSMANIGLCKILDGQPSHGDGQPSHCARYKITEWGFDALAELQGTQKNPGKGIAQ